MRDTTSTATNPLSRAALEAPRWLGDALAAAGALTGLAAAAYVIADQSYDRTQTFAGTVIALVAIAIALSFVAPSSNARAALRGLGAGVIFFAGALLLAQAAGVVMLVAGAGAAGGALIAHHRAVGDPAASISGFFFGAGAVVVTVAVILLLVEG